MSKFQIVFAFTISILLSFSCTSENENTSLYVISNRDFEDILYIEGTVEPVNSTTVTCPRNFDGVIAQLIEDGTPVEEGDVICVLEMQELSSQYDDLLTNLENARAVQSKTIADLDMEYALLEAQVKNNEAATKIAQLDSLQLIYSTPIQRRIKELDLEKVAVEKNKYEKKIQSLEIIQQSELRRRELNVQRLASRAQAVKERLDNLTIKAPKKGLAIRANYDVTGEKLQVGDPVWNAMPLVIIPDLLEMKVKILAPEKDFKYINEGDSVMYTFDAMPENKAWGKITKKTLVGRQIRRNSKVKRFEIEASIDSVLVMPEPGFTANCHIILKQVKDAIVVPQVAIFEEDSMRVVYVKKNGGFETRQISIGISSPKEAVITAGLQKDETVALVKPESSSIKETVLFSDSIKLGKR